MKIASWKYNTSKWSAVPALLVHAVAKPNAKMGGSLYKLNKHLK
ncbi:hypothetical protein [Niallia sp. 03133]